MHCQTNATTTRSILAARDRVATFAGWHAKLQLMCNLYSLTTPVDAIGRLFGVDSPNVPNLPAFAAIYPNREAPVVRSTAGGGREVTTMLWGFPAPDGGPKPVTNVRNLTSPFWRNWLSKPAQRCLVPVDCFADWTAVPDPATGRKRQVWFSLADEAARPFAFAGIWRPAPPAGADGSPALPRMAFLTTMPNRLVASVHQKAMPVILAPADYGLWLTGSSDDILPLARAYPEEEMIILDHQAEKRLRQPQLL
jgi:putative SOS response-associated peptidase YedK